MTDSVIFDLDGTLWDAVDNILISWNWVAAKDEAVKAPIGKKQLEACMGLKMTEIAGKLFPYLTKEKQLGLLNACSQYELEYLAKNGGNIFTGVEQVFESLGQSHRLFICSNCQQGYIECFLGYYGLNKYITDIECWGNTGLSKGENNRLLIERNSLKSPVYVGDTLGDQQAALFAGIPFIYAAYGFGRVDNAIYKLDNIVNLPKVLAEIN